MKYGFTKADVEEATERVLKRIMKQQDIYSPVAQPILYLLGGQPGAGKSTISDRLLKENPNAIFPRLTYGQSGNNSRSSDFWYRNAWFLRLQEVTLNYTMRTKYLRSIGVSGVDFQLIGSNLFVFDSIKEFDPEQAGSRGLAYPIPATYTFQLYIHF